MRKWNVGWGPISHCNMNCQFCYSKYRRKDSKDLEYRDWIKFIDENYFKINSINYGTGENTLDKKWFELVLYIRNKYPEIRQSLTTNGYLSEAVKDSLCMEAFVKGIDEVDVSLDFCDEENHIKFRGQSKAFKWAIDTLKLCKKHNKSATIVFLGSKKNLSFDNIDGLFAIAKEYNAILRMNMYRPTEGINEFSKEFIVPYNIFLNALKYIDSKYSIISLNDTLFSSFLTDKTIPDPSGDRSIRVLADGSITPSTYLIDSNFVLANITEKNVLDKIEKNNMTNDLIKKTIPLECSGCVYENSCAGGVYDRRFLWYSTLEKKDPYCPGKFIQKSDETIVVSEVDFTSVHDGYLPTIFFMPEEEIK